MGDASRRWRVAAWVLAGAVLLTGCAGAPERPPGVTQARAYEAVPSPDHGQVGVASWYGPGFHGRRTASGQRFDMHALTAAHPTLPFGTRVKVTNLANGRSVVLVVNDRGPFVRGRIIDVSHHGAEHLGFVRAGTARVRVRVLGGPGA
jgi:rare lipoprotein A